MLYKIENAPRDNKGILAWFPRSKCWFTAVWDCDRWVSFCPGVTNDFYGEEPTYYMELPPGIGEGY